MRYKYLLLALVSAGALFSLVGYLWQRPSVIPQPLPESLEGRIPMLPQQALVTLSFPVELEGDVVAGQALTLRAPVDGVLRQWRASVEEMVAQGELLATLESAELKHKRLENESKVKELSAMLLLYSPTSSPDLRKLQAALEGGKQKYRYAEATFQKVEELFRRGLISGREQADARVQLEGDKLALAAAEREYADARSMGPANYLKIYNQLQAAELERERLTIDQTGLEIRAPFAGRVRRYAPAKNHDNQAWAVGDRVKASEPLLYIESSNRLIRVDTSPAMLSRFALGDSVQVLSAGEEAHSFPGVVQDITRAPYENSTSAYAESVVQLWVMVSDRAFHNGVIRKVNVSKVLPQQGIPVPAAVVLSEAGERFVYVRPCVALAAPYTRRRVVLSAEQAGMALVTGGVLDGECIAQVEEGIPWGR